MKKLYAHIYNSKTGKHIEIGGYSEEQIEKDLEYMKNKNIITDDCTINIYSVEQ